MADTIELNDLDTKATLEGTENFLISDAENDEYKVSLQSVKNFSNVGMATQETVNNLSGANIPATYEGETDYINNLLNKVGKVKTVNEQLPDSNGNITIDVSGSLPIGSIVSYGGENIPSGYLLCDGRAVSRTDYNLLFAKIGTIYGSGDGSTTFNLPNLTDKFIQGATSENMGSSISAGLPNITGGYWNLGEKKAEEYIGCFDDTTISNNYAISSGSAVSGANLKFKASLGETKLDGTLQNDVYGKSDTVQPPSVTMYFIIKATKYEEATEDVLDDSKATSGNCWSAEKTKTEIAKTNTYSTEETVVGTWIDGKPIYRKVVQAEKSVNPDSSVTIQTGITNCESTVDFSGLVTLSGSGRVHKLPMVNVSDVKAQMRVYLSDSNTVINIEKGSYGTTVTTGTFVFIIEYTKTTD